MKTATMSTIGAILGALAVGCSSGGGGSGGGSGPSCTITIGTGTSAIETCAEGPASSIMAACNSVADAGGVTAVYSGSACSRTGAVGGCQSGGATVWYYSGVTVDMVKQACMSASATFVSP